MNIDMHAHTSTHPMRGLYTTDASLDALEKEAAHYGFDLVMVLATYFPLKGTGLNNRELLQRIDSRPRFRMFGSLNLENVAAGLGELTELAEAGLLAGIKLYPGYQDFTASDTKAWPVYELAKRFRLPVAIHSGELHHCCSPAVRASGDGRCGLICKLDQRGHQSRPLTLRPAALDFPTVDFILCHLGNPYFTEARKLMRECPNVVTDISGQFVSGTEEAAPHEKAAVRKEILEFLKLPRGEERVLFGTDFPIQSYADSVELVEGLCLRDEIKRAIYGGNAQRILERRRVS